jgi:F-type H+-transporting ATPase subunit delta
MERQIATRYAEALFSLARENNLVAPVEEDLRAAAELFRQLPDLSRMLEHPEVTLNRKYVLLEKTFSRAIQPLTFAFLKLLVRRSRSSLLALLGEEYSRLADADAGLIRVEVDSAVAMSEEQSSRLQQALGRLTGKQVMLQLHLAPALLAGVRVRIEDKMLDGSAAGRLEALRAIMQKTGGVG